MPIREFLEKYTPLEVNKIERKDAISRFTSLTGEITHN